EYEFFVSAPDVLVDRFDFAIRGLGGPDCDPATGTPGAGDCLYFNPFGTALTGTGTPNPTALLNDMLAFMSFDARSELLTVEGFASREIGDLPGGTAAIAFGAQHRGEEIEYDYDENRSEEHTSELQSRENLVC